MKHMSALFVLISVFTCALTAQPFFSNYHINNNYWYYYEDLTNDTLSTAAGDDGSEVLTLPFQFKYCGVGYSTIKVSTNGWIQFGASYNGAGNNNDLSDPQYKNFVCPLWDDLYIDALSSISYTTEGSYPARYFKIHWKNVKWKNSSNRKSFQIWLVEFDNSIIFFYGPSTGSSPISSSIGITNNTGGLNNFLSVNIPEPFPWGMINISDSISYNISSLDLVAEGNLIETFTNGPLIKLYQVPDTLYPGEANQVVFALLHYNHPGPVLTPPWMTKLLFNTYGTTNNNDILRAKLYSTGVSPVFNNNHQIGATVENPGSLFEIGNLNLTYFGWLYVSYFWLVFDIAPDAQTGNIIDAACTKVEAPIPLFAGIPDSSMASGHHVIGYPLPVELISFSVESNSNTVLLSWTTASETNNRGFQVEREAVDVHKSEDFVAAGFVNGRGTSTEYNFYSFKDENLSAGKYIYRLKQIDHDGSYEYSNEIEVEVNPVNEFALYQNYPNPFNPSTIIKYSIPISANSTSPLVTLKVLDALGNEAAVLVNEVQNPGVYEVNFDGSSLASGVYYYSLTMGSFRQVKKMAVIK